jgi:3-oxoadipate enol-lactonase
VLRPDLPGHGQSPPAPPNATLEHYAEAVTALLAKEQWLPAIVIGFSFGGMLAQLLALRHQHMLPAVVIGGCASTFTPQQREMMRRRGAAAQEQGMEAIIEPTIQRWLSAPVRATPIAERVRERLWANDAGEWAKAWSAIATLDAARDLPHISTRVLCLAGEKDASAPPAVLKEISEAIPGAALQVITGGSHLFFLEEPQQTAEAIREFINRD